MCRGRSFTAGLPVLPADGELSRGLQLSLLRVYWPAQREASLSGALAGRSADLPLDEGKDDHDCHSDAREEEDEDD